jgi:hypothetical protein
MNDGVSFEVKVERWLLKRGALRTERRVRMPGRVAKHGHEVDVHAVFGSNATPALFFASLATTIVTFVGYVVDSVALGAVAAVLTIVIALLGLAALLHRAHVWVECKSGETVVRREVIWKLVQQLQDVREASPKWYPSAAWLVVRNVLDVETIRFAHEHGIRCFVEQAGDIREVI